MAKQMASVESLCARALYLLALRVSELERSAETLREIPELTARIRELRDSLQQSVARADGLAARLPPESAAGPGGEGGPAL